MENKEIIVEVTQEQHDRQLAEGLLEDEILSIGKHIFRRVTPDKIFARKDAIIRVIESADSDKNIGSIDSNFKA